MSTERDEDRALLEKAAKAAGLTITDWRETLNGVRPAVMPHPDVGRWIWDPLTDDGDALRLAVKLRLDITHGTWSVVASGDGVWEDVSRDRNDDLAATRRAIVRAAAASAGTGSGEGEG